MKTSEQFALNEWLSDYPENMEYAEILDLMWPDEVTGEDKWSHELITPWYVVEHFTLGQVAEFIENTRAHFARVTKEK